MTFLHWSLLLGVVLIGLPILLHFWSQRQPKPQIFPALRFVKLTVQTHRRSWQIRQWLLLALRAAALGLFAFALAGPRVHGDMLATWIGIGGIGLFSLFATVVALVAFARRMNRSVLIVCFAAALVAWGGTAAWAVRAITRGAAPPKASQDAPVAAVFVVDLSPTMGYRFENQSRLDAAREKAVKLIDQMPMESKIAIFSQVNGQFAIDRSTAKRQLDRLEVQDRVSDLASAIQAATQLVRTSEFERREVYVLTDLLVNPWRTQSPSDQLKTAIEGEPAVLLQLIDCGLEKTGNWSISDLKSDQSTIAPGGNIRLEGTVTRTSATQGERITVELLRQPVDPSLPVIRDGKLVTAELEPLHRELVDLTTAETANVSFQVDNIKPGVNHFIVRVQKNDPLMIDDQRYLSIEAGESGKVLVLAKDPARGEELAVILQSNGSSQVSTGSFVELSKLNLKSYQAIAVVDPPLLEASQVELLERYVQEGGGLLLTLGPGLGDPAQAQRSAFKPLLPGEPTQISRRSLEDRSNFFVADSASHPAFQFLGSTLQDVPWTELPVFRHWDLDPLAADAKILMRYSASTLPAIVEQSRGKGRIVTWTTPVPEPAVPIDRQPWNELTSSSQWWPTFGLLLGTMRHLSGAAGDSLNYQVGQPAVLSNPEQIYPTQYRLLTPRGDSIKIDTRNGSVVVPTTDRAGIHWLRGVAEQPVVRGFSVNLAEAATRLDRLPASELDQWLGEKKYKVARELDEIEASVGSARYGRDLFPFVMLLVALVIIAEQYMANRFYQLNLEGAGGRA